MYSSSNYNLYRRPSNASDSSSVTLTDDKCYGLNTLPQSNNYPYSSSYNTYNNYNNGVYNNGNTNYNTTKFMNPYYNSNDEEYKNLPYTPNSYRRYSCSSIPINGTYGNTYNNDLNDYRYNYNLGSSSYPTYANSSFMNNYENDRRNLHRRSLSLGNTPSNNYGNYNYDDDDGVYRDNNNHVYITRSTSSPSRHLRHNSGSFFKRRSSHNLDYLDLPINSDDYYRRRRYRRNSRLFDDYYPERKKSLLENITSKFRKLRFGSSDDDKYEDYYNDDDENYRRRRSRRYSNYLRNSSFSLNSSLTNLNDNQYNNYDNNYYNNYNNNYDNNNYNYNNYNYNNYDNNNNNYNTYNNQNDMYSSYGMNNQNNEINNYNSINRSYSDFTIQPPAQHLVQAPTIDDNGVSSLANYLSTNNYLNDQGYNSSYPSLRRSSSVVFERNHSRHNSLNNYYNNNNNNNLYDGNVYNSYNNGSSQLYNTYNNSQEFQNDNYLNNNFYITNDNLTDNESDINYNKYKLSHRRSRRRSSLKEYVDSNCYSNNYDCNPKYYRSKQPSKVTFDRNVQYWSN